MRETKEKKEARKKTWEKLEKRRKLDKCGNNREVSETREMRAIR